MGVRKQQNPVKLAASESGLKHILRVRRCLFAQVVGPFQICSRTVNTSLDGEREREEVTGQCAPRVGQVLVAVLAVMAHVGD